MVEDRIEREISIAAPVDRVWAVVTEPGHVGASSSSSAGLGGRMVVDHGEHGVFPMKIVTVEPPRLFAYRWAPAFPGAEVTGDNSTLVEFSLRPEGGGTLLRIVETGFASLPGDVAARKYEDNSGGWTHMAERVREYAEKM
jgi:uncharacterized protein YndB with AHSA1/START domain